MQFAQHGGVHAIREAILNTEDITLQVILIIILLLRYRIAGKFGGELNLAVWRYAFKPPN